MSNTLVAFAGEHPELTLNWRLLSSRGDIESAGVGGLEDLSRVPHSEFVLVLPGECVTYLRVRTGAKSEKQARVAAPYAIEDDVAVDVESLHVALAPFEPHSEFSSVWAIDQALMAQWSAALKTYELEAACIVPDYLLAPVLEDSIACVPMGDRLLMRTDVWGATLNQSLGPDLLRAAAESAMRRWGRDDHAYGLVDVLPADVDPYDFLALNAMGTEINLMQGEFALRRQSNTVELKGWRLPVGLVAAAFVCSVGVNVLEGVKYSQGARDMQARTETMFRQAFPEVKRVVNPRVQLRSLVASDGGGSDFLQLSGIVAAGLAELDGLSLEALRYDQTRNELEASIRFSNYDDLAQFRRAIESSGASLREGGSRQSGDMRIGEVTVTR